LDKRYISASAVSYPAFAAPATIIAQQPNSPPLPGSRRRAWESAEFRRHGTATAHWNQNFAAWVGFHGDVGSSALGHFSAAAEWRLRLPDERWVL